MFKVWFSKHYSTYYANERFEAYPMSAFPFECHCRLSTESNNFRVAMHKFSRARLQFVVLIAVRASTQLAAIYLH